MNENKRNKPIALAVTLVILVICLMLNIIFVSKNIDYNQQLQVNTGKTIVSLLEDVREQSLYIDEMLLNNEQLGQHTQKELLAYELKRLESMISQLFKLTVPISPALLSADAVNFEAPKLAAYIALVEQQTAVDSGTHEQLNLLLDDVYAATEKFNFKLKDVKTAMIRISNGFEWPEAVQALDIAVQND